MKTPIYKHIATMIDARLRCQERGNKEWFARWSERLVLVAKRHLPSGSGIDCGTSINVDVLGPGKSFILHFGYHHMNEHGMYTHWTEHTLTVVPNLAHDFRLVFDDFSEEDIDNGLDDYLYEVFDTALREVIDTQAEYAEEAA